MNQPNPLTVGVGIFALLVICAAVFLAAKMVRQPGSLQPVSERPAQAPKSSKPDKTDEYGWILQAMAECDAEAKEKLDKIHFLIVPLSPTGMSLPGWSPQPISDVGHAGKLLSSGDALVGLRNHALGIYQKPVTFVMSDPTTATVYKWKPAIGVAALTTSRTELDMVKLGFELPDIADEVEWGPTVHLQKSTCYWINPLLLAPSR